jgi:predicted nucleic acid-binding protein
MRYLIDTNVLLRWSVADDPDYAQCVAAVDALTAQGIDVCVCAQVLVEYWAVSTRPRDVNGFELDPSDVEERLAEVDTIFTLLTEPPDIAVRWRKLANRYSVHGKQAHDARIAALMLAHGVTHLLTLNTADFARYDGITPVTPQEILHQ